MRIVVSTLFLFSYFLWGDESEVAVLSRRDTLSEEIQTASDPYFEGYIQALVDIHYAEYCAVVIVKDHKVWLANMPNNKMIANSIVSFVLDVPGVEAVHVLNGVPPEDKELREKYVNRPRINGIWFPQMTELYLPMIADPRNVTYTLGWRSGDRVIGAKTIDISLGDDFPIYRWLDAFWGGDIQIGIEAGIWSVFNMDPNPNIAKGWGELVNTDFYAGVPISMALGPWSFRLRGYHISSHLGDEYMIDHPEVIRLNPSIEAIDFFTSYQATEAIRVYVGPGVVVHSDRTFPWKPFYIEYGTEARFLGSKFHKQRLYGTCFLALFWRNEQELHFNFDGTYRAGYEFSKLQGIGRKFRLYVGYHHGYSLEGQFQKERTHYFEFNMNYGF
ncbi:MAG: hypothetical protein A3C42_04095 [Chlamydiae bacterium RIFCSPHIGHO2_02_FULL_45_9]|nr:MAG: hypothetical protein A3C42_04095 [Chlamydiae bacterium RIFCSPHIGHO2_02_FULL_45_9]